MTLIVLDPTGERPTIGVVDTVAIRRASLDFLSNEDHIEQGLAMLWIEPAGTCGPPRTALAMRVLVALFENCWESKSGMDRTSDDYRAERGKFIAGILAEIEHHGDPTPVDDPLARG